MVVELLGKERLQRGGFFEAKLINTDGFGYEMCLCSFILDLCSNVVNMNCVFFFSYWLAMQDL